MKLLYALKRVKIPVYVTLVILMQVSCSSEEPKKINNPMISPSLSNKMNSSGRHMKSAEGRLKKGQIPESIESENQALRQLSETREMLDQLKEANLLTSQKN